MYPPFVALILPIIEEQSTDYLTYYPPSVIPQDTQGLDINVLTNDAPSGTGGFNMTGYTATLLLNLEAQPEPVLVELLLTVLEGGTAAVYTTVGGEFSKAGIYDAQLKVVLSETILYSLTAYKQFIVEAVQG